MPPALTFQSTAVCTWADPLAAGPQPAKNPPRRVFLRLHAQRNQVPTSVAGVFNRLVKQSTALHGLRLQGGLFCLMHWRS